MKLRGLLEKNVLEEEELEILRSTIIQNVSHELRTPLGVIIGYSELLHNGTWGELAPQQQEAIITIITHAQQLCTVVERIGTLMDINGNTGNLLAPLALRSVIMAAVEERRASAVQSDLALDIHIETNLPFVSGSPRQLQQAIDCLVENALKFTPAGGRVEVNAYTEKGWVCLTVSDTGIGIKEEQLDQIFSLFYQADGSTTRRYGGLGLSIAKAVVEAHAGKIEVESKPGQGSRFAIKLPPAVDQERGPDEVSPRFRRILLVDDEEQVTTSLQVGLGKLRNYEIVTANSSERALQLLKQQTFDLVITDYRMPSIDGMALAAHIRRSYPQTAVIMLTTFGSDKLRKQASDVDIRHLLDKPVKLTHLRDLIQEALEGGSLAEPD